MLLGIVLAGGLSRRMGSDKALLTTQGKTQLQRATECLISAGCEQVVVSRNEAGFTVDLYPQQGPLAGIHACLDAHPCDEAVVIPVDMPLLRSESIKLLINSGRDHQHACYFESTVLPCYLTNIDTIKSLCRCHLQQSKRSIKELMRAIAAKSVQFQQSENELFNTNTPQQWQWAQRLVINKERIWGGYK